MPRLRLPATPSLLLRLLLELLPKTSFWAAASRLRPLRPSNIETVVFQLDGKKKKSWEKVGQVEGRERTLCPILLEGQRFMTMIPEKGRPWPEAWRSRPTQTAWKGSGGARNEGRTIASTTISSGWMRPTSKRLGQPATARRRVEDSGAPESWGGKTAPRRTGGQPRQAQRGPERKVARRRLSGHASYAPGRPRPPARSGKTASRTTCHRGPRRSEGKISRITS